MITRMAFRAEERGGVDQSSARQTVEKVDERRERRLKGIETSTVNLGEKS